MVGFHASWCDLGCCGRLTVSAANGTSIVKTQPSPGMLRIRMYPPCAAQRLDREPEAETGAITAASIAEGLEQVPRALRDASAFVLDLDQQAFLHSP